MYRSMIVALKCDEGAKIASFDFVGELSTNQYVSKEMQCAYLLCIIYTWLLCSLYLYAYTCTCIQ